MLENPPPSAASVKEKLKKSREREEEWAANLRLSQQDLLKARTAAIDLVLAHQNIFYLRIQLYMVKYGFILDNQFEEGKLHFNIFQTYLLKVSCTEIRHVDFRPLLHKTLMEIDRRPQPYDAKTII
ncbi:hypothetical protein OUZ56_021655 [Daphnia magna]|uniref:Uncharacterized protein n=1 Tax=Daphnia magna TaxID=35525 RepID=A0ABR0AU42_9CRUS|nr:hypothetical protein OUZ56_021655 [Daphnia magna]